MTCIFHKWVKCADTGVTEYFQCDKCGCRKYEQNPYLYQPINHKWLSGEDVKI